MDDIHEHVRNNDYPESTSGMECLATNAGFKNCAVLYRTDDHYYSVLQLTA